MKIRFSREARQEAMEAASWYARQRVSLGNEFLDALLQTIHRVAENPMQAPKVFGAMHRVVVSKPFDRYLVFFVVDDSTLNILAVFHSARDPKQVQRRYAT